MPIDFERTSRHSQGNTMKMLRVVLPDEMAREVEFAVKTGKFVDASDVVRTALREFISNRRFELTEQQQLADIRRAGMVLS
jgi:Arc/MetJ-type ribon-helix-helix transcriptional regulator